MTGPMMAHGLKDVSGGGGAGDGGGGEGGGGALQQQWATTPGVEYDVLTASLGSVPKSSRRRPEVGGFWHALAGTLKHSCSWAPQLSGGGGGGGVDGDGGGSEGGGDDGLGIGGGGLGIGGGGLGIGGGGIGGGAGGGQQQRGSRRSVAGAE